MEAKEVYEQIWDVLKAIERDKLNNRPWAKKLRQLADELEEGMARL